LLLGHRWALCAALKRRTQLSSVAVLQRPAVAAGQDDAVKVAVFRPAAATAAFAVHSPLPTPRAHVLSGTQQTRACYDIEPNESVTKRCRTLSGHNVVDMKGLQKYSLVMIHDDEYSFCVQHVVENSMRIGDGDDIRVAFSKDLPR